MRCALCGFYVYRSILEPRIEESHQMKPQYANVHELFAIAITASLQESLPGYDVFGLVPRKIFRFCRYFLKLWRSNRRERKGYEVQEVSNTERWTENPNNKWRWKSTRLPRRCSTNWNNIYWSTIRSLKIESQKWDGGEMYLWQFRSIWRQANKLMHK